MSEDKMYLKKLDNYFETHSKKFFLYKKLEKYKDKLKEYRHFDFVRIKEYEKRWRRLNREYKKINLYGIEFVSIGETVPRLFNLLEDINKSKEKVLHVVLPTFFDYYIGGIYNRRLFDVFGKRIYFIRESNIDFWTYVLYFRMKGICTEQFDKYKLVRLRTVNIDLGRPLLPFSKKEILEGESKLRSMGVKGEFICLHARESNVKAVDFGKFAAYDTKCRDCDINTFILTSRYFAKLNMQSVRLGKYEVKRCDEETIIDFSNRYYDEFMDFYLLSRCKFLISSNTGITTICGYWGRPVLATNMIHLCYGGESNPDTGYNMYIPKRFYSKKVKRYLNLYETLDIMDECSIYTSNFVRKGIILEDNTENEILEAAIEFNNRIDHSWIELEEEKTHYEKYWKIINQWKLKHKYSRAKGSDKYTMFSYKLCYSYLKNNLYLLDVDPSLLQ